MTTDSETPNPPVEQIRLGQVRAAIWRSEGKYGVQYRATFEKSFRGNDGWRTTSSFGPADLLVVAKAADLAFDAIRQLQMVEQNETVQQASSGAGRQGR